MSATVLCSSCGTHYSTGSDSARTQVTRSSSRAILVRAAGASSLARDQVP